MSRSLSQKLPLPLAPGCPRSLMQWSISPEESYIVAPLFANPVINLLSGSSQVIVSVMIPYVNRPFTEFFLPFYVCGAPSL